MTALLLVETGQHRRPVLVVVVVVVVVAAAAALGGVVGLQGAYRSRRIGPRTSKGVAVEVAVAASGGLAAAGSTRILTLPTIATMWKARGSGGMEGMRRRMLRKAAKARTDCGEYCSPPARHAGLATAGEGGAGLAGERTAILVACLRDRCWSRGR